MRTYLFKMEQSLGRTDEDFRCPVLNIMGVTKLIDEHFRPVLCRVTTVVGPRESRQHLVPRKYKNEKFVRPVGYPKDKASRRLQRATAINCPNCPWKTLTLTYHVPICSLLWEGQPTAAGTAGGI